MTNKEIKALSDEALAKIRRQANLSTSRVYSRMGRLQAERFVERLESEEQRRRVNRLQRENPDLEIRPC